MPGLTGTQTVVDAYCGTGTIGLVAAKSGAARVIGVDNVASAVRDARQNARHNGVANAEFVAADAGDFMCALAAQKSGCTPAPAADTGDAPAPSPAADAASAKALAPDADAASTPTPAPPAPAIPASDLVLFMDPPRAGASEAFLDAVCALAPERIVYISCNPDNAGARRGVPGSDRVRGARRAARGHVPPYVPYRIHRAYRTRQVEGGLRMSNNAEQDNEDRERQRGERPVPRKERLESSQEEPAYILRSASELSDVNQLVLDAVLDSMHANLYVTDPQTDKILFMNRAMKEEYGLESPEGSVCWQVLQNGLAERCSFCPIDVLSQSDQQAMVMQWEEDSPVTGRLYRNYDSLVTWIDGSIVHLQQSVDITELKTARIDELTGLFTRRFGKDRLREAMDRATDKGESISVCLFDINDLKCVNDAYGHAEGDRFIRAVALAVRREFAASDFGFRLSGDELVAVFHRDTDWVNKAMERVSESLAQEDKGFDHPYDRAFSFGIVEVAPGCESDARDVLDLADLRMYDQKRSYHIARNEQRSHGIAAGAAGAAAGRNAIVPPSTFDYDKDRLYDALVESTDDYLYVCNMKTGVFRYPTAMVEEFGLPGEVIENAAAVWGAHVHEDDRAAFLESNQEITDGRTTRHCIEYRALNRRGEWVWLRCRGRLVLDAVGEPSLFAGFITNLGKKNNVDRATGLFNKFEFKDVAVHALETHPDDEAAFMILGIDDFRHVNDRYDRVFGDAVIRLVAQRIQAALPSCASAYRLDGDEFAVFLRGAGVEEIHDMYKSAARRVLASAGIRRAQVLLHPVGRLRAIPRRTRSPTKT